MYARFNNCMSYNLSKIELESGVDIKYYADIGLWNTCQDQNNTKLFESKLDRQRMQD